MVKPTVLANFNKFNKKMIYEVIYKPTISDNFENHIKNVYKIDFKKDCFIYFHIGPNASKYLNETFPDVNTSYMYIQELEKRFNVTINWFNLEFIFDKLIIYDSLIPRSEDVQNILYRYKRLYFNSIEDYIKFHSI